MAVAGPPPRPARPQARFAPSPGAGSPDGVPEGL